MRARPDCLPICRRRESSAGDFESRRGARRGESGEVGREERRLERLDVEEVRRERIEEGLAVGEVDEGSGMSV